MKTTRVFPRLLFFFLLVLTALPLRATDSAKDGKKEFRIVTSFYPIYIQVLNVTTGISGVTVRNLTKPTTGCLHDYQLRPDELVALAKADLLVINGLGMESFLDKARRQFPTLPVVDASAGFTSVATPEHEHDNDRGHEINAHIWLAPTGAMHQIRVIRDGLIKADPAHAAQYQVNAAAYLAKLEALSRRMHQALAGSQGRKIVTMHEAFPHLAQEFGLDQVAVIEREPGSEPTARELANLVRLIRAQQVKVIFTEPQYPAKTAAMLGRETGVQVLALDSAVTGPDSPDAYLQIMDANLAVLKSAFAAR